MRKMCESCGMPLKNDNGGSNKDGSVSGRYCSYCYKGGKFIHPKATVSEMMNFSVEGMKKKGFPGFMAKLMVKNTPKLPRWQQPDTSKPAE